MGDVPQDVCVPENREIGRRNVQRRADTEFQHHKKAKDGSKFKIKTDSAGNILTNKLRVTTVVNQLMSKFLNYAQISYDDNDERFKLVEELVREQFEFDPPVKDTWFREYMRKKMEKTRSEFRKHFEEKGDRHPSLHQLHLNLQDYFQRSKWLDIIFFSTNCPTSKRYWLCSNCCLYLGIH